MSKLQIQLDRIGFYWDFEHDDGSFRGGMAYITLPDPLHETLIAACADSIKRIMSIDDAVVTEVVDGTDGGERIATEMKVMTGMSDGKTSEQRSPYKVHCPKHGGVYLTYEEYMLQLIRADETWHCPACGTAAVWDDDNYEEMMELLYPEPQQG